MMEELPDTEDIITKLKSSLPICRVCLNVSMEYIEFEATLCVINGREVTFSEGFHELIPDDKNSLHHNMTTSFCATCGIDLLNAYLFMKRIEHANYAFNKVKIFTEERSKLIVDRHYDHSNPDEEEKTDVINFSNSESESCSKENYEYEIYQNKPEDIDEYTAANIRSSIDELVKQENLDEKEGESDYESLYEHEVPMEKTKLLSELEAQVLVPESNEFEPDISGRVSESDMWLSNECEVQCRAEEKLIEHGLNSHSDELLDTKNKQSLSHNLVFHNDLNPHYNNEPTEKKDYICIICSCAFQTKRSLYIHKRHTHKITEQNYQKGQEYKKCQYCRRMIRTSNMEKHLVTHSTGTDNEYSCTNLKETVPRKIDGKQLSYIRTKELNRYACQICGKICLRPFLLRNHIQSKHLSERRKHQCEDCGLFFSFPSTLKEHRRKHNMNNRFKCLHCDRTFIRKPQLDIHMRYHLNDFPYKCDQCDKCYVSKSNLTDHIRSKHTKTTYDCDKCNQKFKSQTGLRKHKYAHDGYPYNCPLCSVGQTSRSGMKQHLMGVHKDALTEEEFNIMFPIIIPKTGYRRPRN